MWDAPVLPSPQLGWSTAATAAAAAALQHGPSLPLIFAFTRGRPAGNYLQTSRGKPHWPVSLPCDAVFRKRGGGRRSDGAQRRKGVMDQLTGQAGWSGPGDEVRATLGSGGRGVDGIIILRARVCPGPTW